MGLSLLEQNADKRASSRSFVRCQGTVSSVAVLGHGLPEPITIENLSTGGAFFYFKTPLRKGHRLKMNIDMEQMVVEVSAHVVRTVYREEGYGVAVSFRSFFGKSEVASGLPKIL